VIYYGRGGAAKKGARLRGPRGPSLTPHGEVPGCAALGENYGRPDLARRSWAHPSRSRKK